MKRMFGYNTKTIYVHTILFILLTAILSPTVLFFLDTDKILGFIIFSSVVGAYFLYVILGYTYLLFKYVSVRCKSIPEFVSQLKTDNIFRVFMANAFGAAWALIYGIFTTIMAFITEEPFYVFVEGIYFSIALIKLYLVESINHFGTKKDRIDRTIIAFLFVQGLSVLICSIMVFLRKVTFTKYDILVYAYAAYAFYALTTGIGSFIKAYVTHNGIRARFFVIKLSCAFFSMFVLTVSLLNRFSDNPDSTIGHQFGVGLIASIGILTIGVSILIWKIKKNHNNKSDEKILK